MDIVEKYDDVSEEEERFITRRRHFFLTMLTLVKIVHDQQRDNSTNRIRTSILTGRAYMQELLEGAEIQFREICRMNKYIFSLLCNEIKDLHQLKESTRVDTEEMVMMCIYILAKGASNRSAQDRFQHSGETISRRFNEVIDALVSLAPKYISLPPAETPQYILDR